MATCVRKAVIPAAGMGTRFLPLTKTLSKELIPLLNKPSIQWIVEELLEAGIEEVILVLFPGREAVLDYFAPNPFLEKQLSEKGKGHLLSQLSELSQKIRFTKVYQKEPLGLGHAVGCAEQAVAGEPFLVILPDDIIDSKPGVSLQMVNIFEAKQKSLVAVEQVPQDRFNQYGMLDTLDLGNHLHQIHSMVEKPEPKDVPGDLGVVGRYLFHADIFVHLGQTKAGKLGEIQLTDAMNALAKSQGMLAYEFSGTRVDIGNPLGWLKANLYFGLKDEHCREELFHCIKQCLS